MKDSIIIHRLDALEKRLKDLEDAYKELVRSQRQPKNKKPTKKQSGGDA